MIVNATVSFVVPVWREEVYAKTCLPWVRQQVQWFGAELVEVRGAQSIFHALEQGRTKARNRYIVYVHDDVRLLYPAQFVPQVARTFASLVNTGLMGPVGKVARQCVPWWENPGPVVGHYCIRRKRDQFVYCYANIEGKMQSRMSKGEPVNDDSKPGWARFAKAGLVDGFFLAEDRERMTAPWDIETFGPNWHGYDMDRCFQAHQLGLDVVVPSWLFLHDCAGHSAYKGAKPQKARNAGEDLWLADLSVANAALTTKWELPGASE